MADFDPDKFLADTAPTKNAAAQAKPFDPDKFLAETAPVPTKAREPLSMLESGISGVAKGLTFGYSDEIIGGARALGAKALGSNETVGNLYQRYRDEQRAHIGQAKEDNPKTFIAGDLAGSVASPVNKVLGPAKGAGWVANAAKGAAGGALVASGESEHNPTTSPGEMKGFVGDAALGGAFGAGTSALLSTVGKLASKANPEAIRKMASDKAVSAAGGMTKEMRELGPEGVHELGQKLLNDKVVTAGVSLEEVAERAATQKKSAGEAIGAALKNVDDLVSTGKELIDSGHLFPGSSPEAKEAMKGMLDKQFQFNMKNIGDRIDKELVAPNSNNPLMKGEVAKLRSLAEDFRAQAVQSLKEGNVIKGTQGRLTNFDSDTVPNAFKQDVYGVIKSELDNVVAKTGNLEKEIAAAQGGALTDAAAAARNGSASDAYQAAKKAYGSYSDTQDMALKSLGRTTANRTIGPYDVISGVGAAATGGAPLGIAVGLGSKAVRKFGDSTAAVTLQKVADVLDKSPVKLGKYAGAISDAIQKGTLPAVNIELMKDPDWRHLLEKIEKTPDPMQMKRDAIKRRAMPLGE